MNPGSPRNKTTLKLVLVDRKKEYCLMGYWVMMLNDVITAEFTIYDRVDYCNMVAKYNYQAELKNLTAIDETCFNLDKF